MNKERNVPFCKPSFSEKETSKILEKLKEPLLSGFLTQGPNVQEFEDRWSRYIGTKHAIAVNSCTAALHIVLKCIGIGEEDEVIVPSNTFVSTANAVLFQNAKPVFAEIDEKTFNIDPKDIKKKITNRTKAIIPVHIAGQPCKMDRIIKIARKNNLYIVEDAAHAHGSVYHNKKCGSFGVAGCFSFYPTKVMTGVEGGIITTNNNEIAERARILRNCGRGGMGPLEITDVGYNYRMNELQAILCLYQMNNLKSLLDKRKKIAEEYTKKLCKIKGIKTPYMIDDIRCSYYAYIVKVKGDRDKLREKLNDRGIGTSIMFHPVHLQPVYRKLFGYKEGVLPVTEETSKKVLSLPIYPKMNKEDIDYTVSTLKEMMSDDIED